MPRSSNKHQNEQQNKPKITQLRQDNIRQYDLNRLTRLKQQKIDLLLLRATNEQLESEATKLKQQLAEQTTKLAEQAIQPTEQKQQLDQLTHQQQLYHERKQQIDSLFTGIITKSNLDFDDCITSARQLLLNISTMFSSFPHKSPIRKQILKQIKLNVDVRFLGEIAKVSPSTISKSNKATNIFKHKRKYKSNKQLLNHDQMMEVIDDIMPVTSGRIYRRQNITQADLYARYCHRSTSVLPPFSLIFDVVRPCTSRNSAKNSTFTTLMMRHYVHTARDCERSRISQRWMRKNTRR